VWCLCHQLSLRQSQYCQPQRIQTFLSWGRVGRTRHQTCVFSTKALAIAVSGHVIHKSSVNGEVLLTSYSWFHDECLVPNRQLSDFPGDVVSWIWLLFAWVGVAPAFWFWKHTLSSDCQCWLVHGPSHHVRLQLLFRSNQDPAHKTVQLCWNIFCSAQYGNHVWLFLLVIEFDNASTNQGFRKCIGLLLS